MLLAQPTITQYFPAFLTTASSSSYIPYKGAVVINGVLYCPYKASPSVQRTSTTPIQNSTAQGLPDPPVEEAPAQEPSAPSSPTSHTPVKTTIKMASQNFGALGATFTVVRAMQAISLITIIGMTSNFISEMVTVDQVPPHVLIGTLSVVSLQPSSAPPPTPTNKLPRLASPSFTSSSPTYCTSTPTFHFSSQPLPTAFY